MPEEDPYCFFDTFITYQDVMTRSEAWPAPTAYGNTDVAALFNGLESLLAGPAQSQFQVIHHRQEYSGRVNTWKTFKEVVSTFILEHVCLGFERPYISQRQYLQQRSFPAQLTVTALWQIHQRINMILPYLLDIPTMKAVSNREHRDLNSLWVYGKLTNFQLQEIWTTKAPSRWILSLRREREHWATMEVPAIVEYYRQCEETESRRRTVGDGRHFAAVRRGGGGRQSIPYYQQQHNWSSAATNRRYQQQASQHHAQSRQGQSQQSGIPLPREGRQYYYNPSYQRPTGYQQRTNYQQQQPQQRPNYYQAPRGGRGAGTMTGRGQFQARGFPARGFQQQQGFAGRQGGVSRRAPVRQEQFHHYDDENPPTEEEEQYQTEGEVNNGTEGQADDAFANEEGPAQGLFDLAQVEQVLDDVAAASQAPADEEFLYQEDEWIGLGYDAPYYEDDEEEAERL